jgi:hypothetical protein
MSSPAYKVWRCFLSYRNKQTLSPSVDRLLSYAHYTLLFHIYKAAILRGDIDMCRKMVMTGYVPTTNNLVVSMHHENLEFLKLVPRAVLRASMPSAIWIAISNNDMDSLRYLVDDVGLSPTEEDVDEAVIDGHLECLQYLWTVMYSFSPDVTKIAIYASDMPILEWMATAGCLRVRPYMIADAESRGVTRKCMAFIKRHVLPN